MHRYGAALDVEDISREVENGDPCACEVFRRAGHLLGLGIASILAVLDMRIVVVGGGISKSHPLFLDTTRETIRERALPTIAGKAEIRMAHFSSNAGIVGAAMLGKHKLELL
jgi:glucokinase